MTKHCRNVLRIAMENNTQQIPRGKDCKIMKKISVAPLSIVPYK